MILTLIILIGIVRTDSGRRFHNAVKIVDFLLQNDNSYTYIKVHKIFNCNIVLLSPAMNICDKIDTVVYDKTRSCDQFPICFNIKIYKNCFEKN